MAHFFLTLSSAGLAFVYACLVLLDGNEVGAKVFYAVVSVVIFGITPGEIRNNMRLVICISILFRIQ